MARIRSIHPGLFTDEAFASLSMAARVLLLGVWTEADDHGVFEWKPVTLKMRIMPVDNVDIPSLLDECLRVGIIKSFTSGKNYGLVRNFCRYQRPKKPKYIHPMPPELRTFVGLKPDGSLPVLHQSRTDTEKPAQREEEDGGGEGEEESGSKKIGREPSKVSRIEASAPIPTPMTIDFQLSDQDRAAAAALGMTDIEVNRELSKFIASAMRDGTKWVDWSAAWSLWCLRWKDRAKKPSQGHATSGVPFRPNEEQWRDQIARWNANNSHWSRQFGPEPGMGGCRCPPELLRESGIDPATGLRIPDPAPVS